MNFNYSDIQKMLFDSAEKLIVDNYGLEQVRAQREISDGLNTKNWNLFAEMGWLGLTIPEEANGLDCPFADVVVLCTMLGRALAVEPFVSSAVIGAHIIRSMSDGEVRDELLGQIASGEARLSLAHDEPKERYCDGGPRQTSATISGNGFALTGEKVLVNDAPSATHHIVSARLEDGSLGLFLVPATTDGLKDERYPLVDGSKAADLFLENVQVPAVALVASGEEAESLLNEARDRASLALMAQAVGAMEACNELTSEYIKERQQFGQPIGKFQALQHMMADMFMEAHQSRSVLYHALANVEADELTRSTAISAAKALIGKAAQIVSRSGIQLHGGYGVTDEYMVSHYFRRLLVLEKQLGDIDFHARRLANAIFCDTKPSSA